MRRNPPSKSGKAANPKNSEATGRDKSRSPDSSRSRDNRSRQLNPSSSSRQKPSSGERLNAAERKAQEAHREFMEKLAKTRGEGFLWLDD